MYQKGDYVVYSGLIYIVKYICATCITGRSIVGDKKFRLDINNKHLRPAVLSDWAKEIPEKYIKDGESHLGGGQLFYLIKHMGQVSYYYAYLDSPSKLIYLRTITQFEADALSAHYSIPVMPYELYQKYMETQK